MDEACVLWRWSKAFMTLNVWSFCPAVDVSWLNINNNFISIFCCIKNKEYIWTQIMFSFNDILLLLLILYNLSMKCLSNIMLSLCFGTFKDIIDIVSIYLIIIIVWLPHVFYITLIVNTLWKNLTKAYFS